MSNDIEKTRKKKNYEDVDNNDDRKGYGWASINADDLTYESYLVKSVWNNKPRFNDFLFGVHVTGCTHLAYDYPAMLFDPHGLIVGQEDKLMGKMSEMKMVPESTTTK